MYSPASFFMWNSKASHTVPLMHWEGVLVRPARVKQQRLWNLGNHKLCSAQQWMGIHLSASSNSDSIQCTHPAWCSCKYQAYLCHYISVSPSDQLPVDSWPGNLPTHRLGGLRHYTLTAEGASVYYLNNILLFSKDASKRCSASA